MEKPGSDVSAASAASAAPEIEVVEGGEGPCEVVRRRSVLRAAPEVLRSQDTGAPVCQMPSGTSSRGSLAAAARADGHTSEYRLRFFIYNMGNSSNFNDLAELQGPGGRGTWCREALSEPFADGGDVDLCFSSFVETRLTMTSWLQDYLAAKPAPLDRAVSQNACREGGDNWLASLAASYNGNLKTVLAFAGSMFEVVKDKVLFGRLSEGQTTLTKAVPNPKKAFIGRLLTIRESGVQLCFVGAHFPIKAIANALEDPANDPPMVAKSALAKVLRKLLRKASEAGIMTESTMVFAAGDLNSRMYLDEESDAPAALDVLQELLADDEMQDAIEHQLPIPRGRWHEVARHKDASSLPVTYKFHESIGAEFDRCIFGSSSPKASSPKASSATCPSSPSSGSTSAVFTVGDVLSAGAYGTSFSDDVPSVPSKGVSKTRSNGSPSCAFSRRKLVGQAPDAPDDMYRRTMRRVGSERLKGWGLQFKDDAWKPFRFPCSADRVICWVPDALRDRVSWVLPRGGYEVNHRQAGSDHRPVNLDMVLHVAPPGSQHGPGYCPGRVGERLSMCRASMFVRGKSGDNVDGKISDPTAMAQGDVEPDAAAPAVPPSDSKAAAAAAEARRRRDTVLEHIVVDDEDDDEDARQ